MTEEPRHVADYSPRQVEAAHRALVDVGQVLASFKDCLVVVGGWVPDLLLGKAEQPHVGSIDVDLVLDTVRLGDGRYAELLKLLLDTKRYKLGSKPFQFVVDVDLEADRSFQSRWNFSPRRGPNSNGTGRSCSGVSECSKRMLAVPPSMRPRALP